MAQGRIPQKQAVAFGYITQLLLQTVPGIRSEYVSVYGYRAWENNLKSKVTATSDTPATPPDSTDGGTNGVILSEQSERRTSPNPSPGSVAHPASSTQSPAASSLSGVQEKATPDYGDLLRRSRDLLDRKYDATPEGRREANALALELELMNPAPAKPRRDFFSRTVDLVRRVRAHQTKKSQPGSQQALAVAASAPALSSPPVALASAASAPPKIAAAPPPASAPTTPESQPCSSGRAAAQPSPPPAKGYPLAAKVYPQDELLPPSKDALSPADKVLPHSSAPPPRQEGPAAPIPGFTLTRTGHSTDWYAPASWSGPQPNPFPSRKERLAREFPTMSNSRWRRLQHRNSRAF